MRVFQECYEGHNVVLMLKSPEIITDLFFWCFSRRFSDANTANNVLKHIGSHAFDDVNVCQM